MPSPQVPTKTWDVVALGEAMVEFNQTRAQEPQYLQGFGGDTSNAVIAASRAGAKVAYLSRVGQDAFGEALLDLWRTEGVDTVGVERDPQAHTGVYFVTHRPEGHAFSYLRAGSAASCMTPQWLGGDAVQQRIVQAKMLHVSGISLAISTGARDTVLQAMRRAKANATQVALDSNLRLKLWSVQEAHTCLSQAIGLCDLFLPSLEDIHTLTGMQEPEAIVRWSHDLGAKHVVLKLGANGALVSDGQRTVHVPGMRVQAVDATGAGDCFCGNLLARLTQGDTLVDATRYANAAASIAVQGFGAVAPLPIPEQVWAVLNA